MTLQERRAIAREAGKCGSRRKRYPEPGTKTCAVCLDSRNRSGEAHTQRVVNVTECCQSSGAHRFDCSNTPRGPGPFLTRRTA